MNFIFYLKYFIRKIIIFLFIFKKFLNGDWGLGIGDWGLGPIPNPQLHRIFLIIRILYKYIFIINIK